MDITAIDIPAILLFIARSIVILFSACAAGPCCSVCKIIIGAVNSKYNVVNCCCFLSFYRFFLFFVAAPDEFVDF